MPCCLGKVGEMCDKYRDHHHPSLECRATDYSQSSLCVISKWWNGDQWKKNHHQVHKELVAKHEKKQKD